jgi:hypothetical protein
MTKAKLEDSGMRKMFGRLEDEYEIYVENARSLGWEVRTFDEWLNS